MEHAKAIEKISILNQFDNQKKSNIFLIKDWLRQRHEFQSPKKYDWSRAANMIQKSFTFKKNFCD